MKFLLSYNMKILTKLGGREMTFGGEMGKFLASGVGTPAPPASRENPVVFPPKKDSMKNPAPPHLAKPPSGRWKFKALQSPDKIVPLQSSCWGGFHAYC